MSAPVPNDTGEGVSKLGFLPYFWSAHRLHWSLSCAYCSVDCDGSQSDSVSAVCPHSGGKDSDNTFLRSESIPALNN